MTTFPSFQVYAESNWDPNNPPPKFVATGNIFCCGATHQNRNVTHIINVPGKVRRYRRYLAYIFVTMVAGLSGDFDDDDAVYVDIYSIDNKRRDTTNGFGGAWDNKFGSKGAVENMAISSSIGVINDNIMFRLSVHGDDFVGASFVVMEL